jgi:Homeodomain-like domain
MPLMQATQIEVSDRQLKIMKRERNKRTVPLQLQKRLDIVLKSAQGMSNSAICRELNLSYVTVLTWRNRWSDNFPKLCEFEAGIPNELMGESVVRGKILEVLTDAPRSGKPKRITAAQESQIIALACKKPRDFGIEKDKWDRDSLAQVAIGQHIIERISPRKVGYILKKQTSAPQDSILAQS